MIGRGMLGRVVGIGLAILLHAAVLLFGGVLFRKPPAEEVKKVEVVDLMNEEQADKDKKKDADKEKEPVEEAKAEEKQDPEEIQAPDLMPDMKSLATMDAANTAPALDAMSLSAMADLLNPGAAGGDIFSGGADLTSGGRIGGTGSAVQEAVESIFTIADLDQKPRPLVQPPPSYPFELRRRKVEGSVSVLFVVDEDGRVVDPRVERSTDPAFDRPALEAIRQWRFEPAVRAGQKVKARLRVPMRFAAS